MPANLLYVLGTALSWLGWGAALRAVWLVAQWVCRIPGWDPGKLMRSIAVTGGLAAVALLATVPVNMHADQLPLASGGWRFPLVWFVMPYSAWLGAACVVIAAIRGVQANFAVGGEARRASLNSLALALGGAALFYGLYRLDPTNKITVLTGGIPFSPTTAMGLVVLAIAAIFAMGWSARETRTRGYAKTVTVQAMLLVGSVVFGLPFAFLVITSFKEDRDMSSANGIIWIPRVQDTVPFKDPKDPRYEAKYHGQTVQGTVLERHADGRVRIDIFTPLAIRGTTFETSMAEIKEVPKQAPLVTAVVKGTAVRGMTIEDMDDGRKRVQILEPANLKGQERVFNAADVEPVRHIGPRLENYSEALSYLPPETNHGLVYLRNTLILVVFSVVGTILSSSIVAYAFSRMNFPGKTLLFNILLSTMMLPAAVTMMPRFLIFRQLGWIDTLYPLWVPAFLGSAFNIFLLRQFFMQIPMELEDAAKIDGCTYIRTFWNIMLPQIKPALAVIAIWTFMGAWNDFMGPLIYVNSPENMPISYALQLFQGDRSGEPGLLMAFSTLCMVPVLALFFFAQRYFIEGVTLSGLGGR